MAGQLSVLNYRVIRIIGKGGMGTVYLAAHTSIDRTVAIKELRPEFARDSAIRERFRNEAALMANLSHPNIVSLHDYVETQQGVYLIMEYVDGTPLDYYIEHVSGPIPEPKAIEMFLQILSAFAYAHQRNIIHRDIKPSNIMVGKNGEIKVLDFGIAKNIKNPNQKLTQAGVKMGTIFYMSPEQILMHDQDGRSDIYSLGLTLFEMLTGRNPYQGENSEYEISHKIVQEEIPRAREFYPNISNQIQVIIDKATAKKPEDRYQNVGEFIKALTDLKENQSVDIFNQHSKEWVIKTENKGSITKNETLNESPEKLVNHDDEDDLEEFPIFRNGFGEITSQNLVYFKGKDYFEKGKKEKIALSKINSVELKSRREILSGLFFLSFGILLVSFLFYIVTIVIACISALFGILCFARFPIITITRYDAKKIKMRGWPWHFRAASVFQHHLHHEIS